jgi:twitching motility protein PilT
MHLDVGTQLADCLVGVVAQRLRWLPQREMRVAECEVLVASQNARAMIRQSQFFKLQSALETGAADGSWTFARYREWLDRRTDWSDPAQATTAAVEAGPEPVPSPVPGAPARAGKAPPHARAERAARGSRPPGEGEDRVLEIDAEGDDLDEILKDLGR